MNSAIRQVLMQLALEGGTVSAKEFLQWRADAGLRNKFIFKDTFTTCSNDCFTINQAGLDFIEGDSDEQRN